MLQPLAFQETIVGAITVSWNTWWNQGAIALTAMTSIRHPFPLLLLSITSPWLLFSGVSKMILPMFCSQAVLGGTSHSASCLTLKMLRCISCLWSVVWKYLQKLLICFSVFSMPAVVLSLGVPLPSSGDFTYHLYWIPFSVLLSSFCLVYALIFMKHIL